MMGWATCGNEGKSRSLASLVQGVMMENIILRTNAIPVYGFLSFINARHLQKEISRRRKILDCGAGGPVPPLALFHQHGFEAWGIDAADDQLNMARQFCEQQGIELHLRAGDMRRIPFEDETFDYVYEHYSMCHLSKGDTALAVSEMYRVLKPQGLCLLGVISMDSWPKSLFGQERKPGEYWGEEGGDELTLHSMFSDEEADELVSAWEIVSKEKQVRYLREAAKEMSLEGWTELLKEVEGRYSQEAWRARYAGRANMFRYAHLYFLLRKA
jgi:ubiquinone/menaquinone biosynthesis C-methylase UbiE